MFALVNGCPKLYVLLMRGWRYDLPCDAKIREDLKP
jgi:hypothetical protein